MNTDTRDYTSQFDSSDINSNKGFAVLAYLGILILIPFFAAGNSRFAKFHVNQGAPIAIGLLILNIAGSFLGWIPVLGTVVRLILRLLNIPILVLVVMGIINAASGKAKTLPVIGGFNMFKF